MLRYKCLVLDHDDTVVQSEATVNHPFFIEFLKEYRPGMTISQQEYISGCFHPGYIEMCRQRFAFTDEELLTEYNGWKEYIRSHVPEAYPGIGKVIADFKRAGGIVCVVSQSAQENIARDYRIHFCLEPDAIYGWDLEPEHRKPNPWALHAIMEKYGLTPEDLLVVDDMKAAVGMARAAGTKIAFAGWGRKDFPHICSEMEAVCDYSFYSPEALADFLFI